MAIQRDGRADGDTGTVAWPVALAMVAIAGSLATACMMPFVAIATLAAATMPRARALVAVIGVWAANQIIGFGLLGYPWSGYAIVWGLAIGGAGVAALFVARRVLGRSSTAATLALAFGAAFIAFEALLFAFALVAGGTGTFAPAIVLRILANDAAWFVVLTALHFVLTRVAPTVFGRPAILRLA